MQYPVSSLIFWTGRLLINSNKEKLSLTSKLRGWLLPFVLFGVTLCCILIDFLLVLIRNNEYSIVLMKIQNCSHFTLKYFVVIAFITVKVVLLLDLIVYALVNFGTIYVTCITTKFWLRQVW